MNNYFEGSLIRLTGTFRNRITNVVSDPTAISFKFTTPAGVTTTYVYATDAQLVKSATGIYYVDLSLAQSGVYAYRFIGTGNIQAAGQEKLNVIAAVPA